MAEPATRQRLAESGIPLDEFARQASAFLQDMAAVGILEDFDRSLAASFAACQLAAPAGYAVKQRLTDPVAETPGVEPVTEVAVTADERLIAEPTPLYRQSCERLARDAAGVSAAPAGAPRPA
jgi:hypothetical protein